MCGEGTEESADEAIPGPFGNAEAAGYIVRGAVIASHGGGGRPREIIVKRATKARVAVEADVFERLIETSDGALVHFLVQAVAAVNADNGGFIAVLG